MNTKITVLSMMAASVLAVASMNSHAADTETHRKASKVERVAEDSAITTKAKADILATDGLKSMQISVETHKGVVLLSGFVDNADMKRLAEDVVSKIDGVRAVKNSLVVKGS